MNIIIYLLRWKCEDRRYLIKVKEDDVNPPAETITASCLWYKNYSLIPTQLECILTYCDNATDLPNDNGANYNFTWDGNVIPLNTDIIYPCMDGMHVENDTYHKEEASNVSVVHCASDGHLKYPDPWPQCSEDIFCGEPPLPPTQGGSRFWVVGDEGDDSYNSYVSYRCLNGSEFDTDGDGAGDTIEISISCRWNKTWDPWPILPPCYITDCIDPFPIPADTFLEEVSATWTRVNSSKEYRCQGMGDDGVHTRFFESDRTVSEFSQFCKPDGQLDFIDVRVNWPTCLEGLNHPSRLYDLMI